MSEAPSNPPPPPEAGISSSDYVSVLVMIVTHALFGLMPGAEPARQRKLVAAFLATMARASSSNAAELMEIISDMQEKAGNARFPSPSENRRPD